MIDEKRARTHKNTEEDCSGLSLALTLLVLHTSVCSTHTHTHENNTDGLLNCQFFFSHKIIRNAFASPCRPLPVPERYPDADF